MHYLLIYLSIGVAVSLTMALIHLKTLNTHPEGPAVQGMVDVFIVIALAWPVLVVAFVYGTFHSLLAGRLHSSNSS